MCTSLLHIPFTPQIKINLRDVKCSPSMYLSWCEHLTTLNVIPEFKENFKNTTLSLKTRLLLCMELK